MCVSEMRKRRVKFEVGVPRLAMNEPRGKKTLPRTYSFDFWQASRWPSFSASSSCSSWRLKNDQGCAQGKQSV